MIVICDSGGARSTVAGPADTGPGRHVACAPTAGSAAGGYNAQSAAGEIPV